MNANYPDEPSLNHLGLAVADHITAMLGYWDKDLVCRFANAAYRDWFGKTRDEMVGKVTLKELLGPLYEKNLPFITGALAGKPQTFEREICMVDGTVHYTIANYFPDIIEGQTQGFFVHVADVTPLKLLEKELKHSAEVINDQNKRLLNFANIVSHNLKTYAFNLKEILNILISAASEDERAEMTAYLQSISNGFSSTVEHLSEIVDAQNLHTLKPEPTNLCAFIEQTIGALRINIEECKATVINKVSNDVVLLANPAYLESILLNFLTNGLKYRQPGRDPVITLDAAVVGRDVLLSIKDNGSGIDLSRHGKDLFGMYKTFHGNTDAKGIGLFITKFQVEAMGGTIRVESEKTKGTTFFIHFKELLV